jgi:hypothetical protein
MLYSQNGGGYNLGRVPNMEDANKFFMGLGIGGDMDWVEVFS